MFDITNGCNSCEAFPSVDNFMNSNELGPMNSNVSAMNNNNNLVANNSNNANNANNNLVANNNVNNNSNSLNNRINNSNNLRKVITQKQPAPQPAPQLVQQPAPQLVQQPARQQENKLNKKQINMCIQLGLVILAALATNEAAKYYIEQQLKFSEGNNMYYVAYAIATILLVAVINRFLKH